jgi:hypothetical protein
MAEAAPPRRHEREAVLDAARVPAEKAVGAPVRFVVRRLEVDGRWAFLLAAMQDPHGERITWAGTRKAEAAAHGLVSSDYAALLWHGDDGRWTVVTHADGPTDVAWADWPSTYGAPAALIGR